MPKTDTDHWGLPAAAILEQARRARDPRFDGRFFVAVTSTGIYCRPVCPVKMPKAANVRFFATAAAATEAGYRPCLRCRPETSPGTPAWCGSSTTVGRALKLIHEGALDNQTVSGLCERLGVTPRHLTRLFSQHLGASPKTVAQVRRLHFAKRLIDETTLPMTEIALTSGYGSVRRFNDHVSKTYGRAPSQLRRDRRITRPVDMESVDTESLEIKIPYRLPFAFPELLAFFRLRAIPGVEQVTDTYSRSFVIAGASGRLEVRQGEASQLVLAVSGGSTDNLMVLVNRVRAMFDVDAIPDEINDVLCADADLAKLVCTCPGLRLPGAFDPFEISVRAIVGQQVSVKGASTVMGRIAERYGTKTEFGLQFPSPSILANLDPAMLSMPTRRAEAIRLLATAVLENTIRFDMSDEVFREKLLAIPGIGPWTADYILMRVLRNPDAFLHGDLVIRKSASAHFGLETEKTLLARADTWRPWRGYAAMHLWRHAK